MRVLFKSKEAQKRFFSLVKGDELTWKQLYDHVVARSEKHFTFRSFQNWYKGLWSPTLEAINAIWKLTQLDLRKMDVKIMNDIGVQLSAVKRNFEFMAVN